LGKIFGLSLRHKSVKHNEAACTVNEQIHHCIYQFFSYHTRVHRI
jgi:hypothetical protein